MRFRRKEWLSVLLCTVATAVGVTLASPFIFMVIFTVGMAGGFENASTYIELLTKAGLILGTIIGFGQKLTLIGQASRLNWWIRASILGGTLGGLIVGSLGETAVILSVAMPGIAIGIAQQFVLMKFLKKATVWGWIPVNIIAWIVAQVLFIVSYVVFLSTGFVPIFQLNPVPTLFALLFSGAIPGLITGIYLTRLLRNFKKE